MSSAADTARASASELRRQFDESFAEPEARRSGSVENLITLRIGGESLAVRTAGISGIAKLAQIVPLRSRIPGFLGIASIHGTLYPVYDLAFLLGIAAALDHRWALLRNGPAPLALAFEELEGQVEIEPSSLCAGSSGRHRLTALAQLTNRSLAVIDILAIAEDIRIQAGLQETKTE